MPQQSGPGQQPVPIFPQIEGSILEVGPAGSAHRPPTMPLQQLHNIQAMASRSLRSGGLHAAAGPGRRGAPPAP
jgi:hypothetical protein